MGKNREINPAAFEKMLLWLDEDRDIAGRKFEAIRMRLIKIFDFRQCLNSEELADKVFDRVLQKISEIETNDGSHPAAYFIKVANYIYLENLRKPLAVELSENIPQPEENDDFQTHYECLKKCLKTLPEEKRKFIVSYYEGEKQAKINLHKKLAANLGIELKLMHSKAYRTRISLQKCVLECVGSSGR